MTFRHVVQSLLLGLLPLLAQAHGFWIELDGSGRVGEPVRVKLFFGEYAHGKRETGPRLNKMADIRVVVRDAGGAATPVALTQTDTHWEGQFTPAKAGHYQVLGLNDTRQVQDWSQRNMGVLRPIQYLRADYVAGEGEPVVSPQALDVAARLEGNTVGLRAFRAGQPFAGATLRVVSPDGWEKVLTANERGRASFVVNRPGLYIVELEWTDKTPGTHRGSAYQSTRHRCDMTLVMR